MSGPICVTLNAINIGQMPAGGGARLLAHLGKTRPDDEPLPLVTILDSNGMEDAMWALRVVKGEDARIRRFAVWCARQVQHLMTDSRSVDALTVAERYADGMATDAELQAANLEAWKVPDISAWTAAGSTAGAAARAAVAAAQRDAAWAAAGKASWEAAVAARRDARSGGDAAEEAAWTAARAAQAVEFRRAFGGDA
jgi:hypothetical protein